MNQYSPNFLRYFGLLLLVYVFVYVLGSILLSKSRLNVTRNISIFLKLTVGIASVVVVYALIKTKFNSIYLLSLPISLFFLKSIQNKKNESLDRPISHALKDEVLLFTTGILILFVIYSISYYFFYIYTDGSVFADNQFYSNVATTINKYGIETNNIDWTDKLNPVPYHYTDIWFVAFFSWLFHSNPLNIHYLLYIPLFGLIVFQGALSIFFLIDRQLKSPAYIGYFLATLFLILQNIDLPFIKPLLFRNFHQIGGWVYNLKLSIVFIFFEVSVIFIYLNRYQYAFLFQLLLIPFYSPIAPAILSGNFALLLFLGFKRRITMPELYKSITVIVVITFFYVLFYYSQSNYTISQGQVIKYGYSKILHYFFIEFKVYTKLLLFGLLPYFACIHLYLPKKIIYSYNSLYGIIYLVGVLVVLGLIIPFYFVIDHDGFQLLSNFIAPFFILLFFITLSYIISIKSTSIYIVCFLFTYFIILLYQYPSMSFNMSKESYLEPIPDDTYFTNIKRHIQKYPYGNFAYCRNYQNRYLMDFKPFLIVPDNRITHFTDNYIPLCLSVFEIRANIDHRYFKRDSFSFYKFVEDQKNTGKFTNLEVSMAMFVKQHNLKFIIIEARATFPQFIKDNYEAIFINKINGNRFFVLKNSFLKSSEYNIK